MSRIFGRRWNPRRESSKQKPEPAGAERGTHRQFPSAPGAPPHPERASWSVPLEHLAALAAPIVVPAPHRLRPLLMDINALTRPEEMPRKIELLGLALERLNPGQRTRLLRGALLAELGIALTAMPDGDPDQCLERAIACFTQARELFSQTGSSAGRARAHALLGRAYWLRDLGSRRENLEQAMAYLGEALWVFRPTEFPLEYARIQIDLGRVYVSRVAGSRRENLEQAIRCCTEALRVVRLGEYAALRVVYALSHSLLGKVFLLRIAGSRRENLEQAIESLNLALAVFTREEFPYEYADTQNKLGIAYAERISGDRGTNLERAIVCFGAALDLPRRADFAFHFARVQLNLGEAYRLRLAGDRRDSLERAMTSFDEAIRSWTANRMPLNLATAQKSQAEAYLDRIAGDRAENVERAIAALNQALEVWTLDDFPMRYAEAQVVLGRAWQVRLAGERTENLERAAACFHEALRIYTPEDFPLEHRNTQLDRALLAYNALADEARPRADPAGLRAAWEQAHAAFAAARATQAELAWLEPDEQGHVRLQSARSDARRMYARDAWCLWQLGDAHGAAAALEAGRAHALTEAHALAEAVPGDVCPDHAALFLSARREWQEARRQEDRGALRAARDTLLEARRTVRAHCVPDFLPSEPTYQEIARGAAPQQALVYIAATEYGALAIVVPPPAHHVTDGQDADGRAPAVISLPRLTEEVVGGWLVRRDAGGRVVGGYAFAAQEHGTQLLRDWAAKAPDEDERARRLATPLCDLAPLLPDTMPTMREAIAEVVAAWRAEADLLSGEKVEQQEKARELRARLKIPLREALAGEMLVNDLGWFLREAELELLLDEMQSTFTQDLRRGLDALGLSDPDQPIALVPCGRLGVLPLHAAWARRDPLTGERIPLAETCVLTLQASARALAAARRAVARLPAGGPILTVGDPRPVSTRALEWAEAEAGALAILGRRSGRGGSQAIIGEEATLARIRRALGAVGSSRPGAWMHIAGHGHADATDPTQCYLLLAHDERLTLAQLQRERLLEGVRGFGASGCVTGLGDADMAPDELSSFAAGVLQAGSPCAVATLWSVSDRATFLLMLRFAQSLLGGTAMMPARAAREAAQWLRTATESQVEELGQRGLKGLCPPHQSEHEFSDSARGLALAGPGLAVDDRSRGREGTRMSPSEAFALLTVPPTRHRHGQRPYAHPIFWAAIVVYGA